MTDTPEPNEHVLTMDFESRSTCDIKKCGSWKYSLDPTTEVLCLAFRLPFWEKGRVELWHPAFSHLEIPEECSDWGALAEMFRWVRSGRPVEGHNSLFERGIWTNIMIDTFGFPEIGGHQWRCSAAKAAAHALPRKLEDASDVLETEEEKDMEGNAVMLKMAKPRKPTKDDLQQWYRKYAPCRYCTGSGKTQELKKDGTPKAKLSRCQICEGRGHTKKLKAVPPMPVLYHETPEMFQDLWSYCKQDVLAEEGVSELLDDLTPLEIEMFLLDHTINVRGFQLDMEAVDIALELIRRESEVLNKELEVLTDGQVARATQRDRMTAWLKENGLDLPDTKGATIDGLLESRDIRQLPSKVWRALELMRTLGRSSTAKYQKMRSWACPDGRVRGGLLYHGAGTGRWAGKGVQPHNFPKGILKEMDGGKVNMDRLWATIKTKDRDLITQTYDAGIMEVLSHALRGAIVAKEDHQLYIADYAQIEVRVLFWLAGDAQGMRLFAQKLDPYCDMATDVYKRTITKADDKERQLGKAIILGCGFQMGASKFVATAKMYGVEIPESSDDEDEITAQRAVDTYREKYWRVKELWWSMEAAAIKAVNHPGTPFKVSCVKWLYEEDKGFLYCILPSGRRLAYAQPEIHEKATPWGEMRPSLTFMGVNSYSHQWQRTTAYGGLLVENVVQATARDIMAEAMYRCERSGVYFPVLSVHDEILTEVLNGCGSLEEFIALLERPPRWAKGCPIAAEGFVTKRYRK